MSEHLVVDYLRTNSVASLERLGIYARWSTVHPEKFSLNYDQIEAVDGDPLVEQCRGLVLVQETRERGEPGRYRVVAQPFRRFYNLGQPSAAEIDWATAAFEEKMDGTLCIVYHHGGAWNVATRSMPDADVPSPALTFAERFWAAATFEIRGALDEAVGLGRTFCFELTAPDNQIVIPYDDTRLTLLGVFSVDGSEAPWTTDAWGLPRPRRWRFGGPAEAARWVNEQPGIALEGLVVVDGNGARVKIKNSQYLAVASVMSSANTDKGLTSIILSGTADDVRQWLPVPRQARLDELAAGVRAWAGVVEQLAEEARERLPDRKAAAMAIQATPHVGWIGTILDIAAGKAPNVSEWIAGRKSAEGVLPPSLVEKIAVAAGGI
jgi:hypothetical protein